MRKGRKSIRYAQVNEIVIQHLTWLRSKEVITRDIELRRFDMSQYVAT